MIFLDGHVTFLQLFTFYMLKLSCPNSLNGPVKVIQLFRIHFNCRAAAAATFIGSLIFGLLASMGILPVRPWTASLGYGVFFLFLVYWQHMRRFFRSPIIVFFDKLCISQDQEDLKLKSIYGLASFLDRSDELVILWSETYFSRLWCTYERLGLGSANVYSNFLCFSIFFPTLPAFQSSLLVEI